MKKYLLLYISLFFYLCPQSRAMDYNQDGEEYDQGDSENVDQQMSQNPMIQEPNMVYQNNMMMNPMEGMQNQLPMQNTGMMQEPNMMYQNNIMMNQMGGMQNGANQEDETSKKEYVQSLVNNILKVNDNRRKKTSQNTIPNGGMVIDRKLKNKLFRLQKDLDEISRSLSGISEDDATFSTDKKSKSSEKTKSSTNKKSVTPKKASHSKKSKYARSKFRQKSRSQHKPFSTFDQQRHFYTVKQLTPNNAIKYVPKFYSYGYDRRENRQRSLSSSYKRISYNVKNWGTGEIIPEEVYYSRNSYFFDKSKCKNGCEAK